jgi:hypothetical protein
MEFSSLFGAHPLATLLIGLFVIELVLFLARAPVHRALDSLGQSIAGGFRLLGRMLYGAAATARERHREAVIAAGRTEMEKKIDRELGRISDGFAKELGRYPELHRQLESVTKDLRADLDASRASPPDPPGWGKSVDAVAAMAQGGDAAAKRLLGDVRRVVVEGEKRVLCEYREDAAKRHRILSKATGHIHELVELVRKTFATVNAALATTKRIDAAMERYEALAAKTEDAVRACSREATIAFVVALGVTGVALGGAFVNFNLIALPMSELVPAGTRVAGVPVATIAALVIVLMEAAAGIFLMDALGVTELLPRIGQLSRGRRRLVGIAAFTALLLLAGIEASLAILREQIVEAGLVVQQALAGQGKVVDEPVASLVPVVGQAVLGFILPFILALVAIPLEMLVANGTAVGGRVVAFGLEGLGALARLMSHGVRQLTRLCGALFDVVIIVPLALSRLVQRSPAPRPAGRLARAVTSEQGVPS